MKTVSESIRAAKSRAGSWPALARLLGVQDHQPRDWSRRGAIPPEYQKAFVETCAGLGVAVTAAGLDDLHARRVRAVRKHGGNVSRSTTTGDLKAAAGFKR